MQIKEQRVGRELRLFEFPPGIKVLGPSGIGDASHFSTISDAPRSFTIGDLLRRGRVTTLALQTHLSGSVCGTRTWFLY